MRQLHCQLRCQPPSPLRYFFAGVITIHGAVVKTGEVVAWQIFKKGYK